MSTQTQLQQNRRIIHDFSTTTLAVIPSLFARLIYMTSLRDLSSGRYEHAGLNAVYPKDAVQQALQQCHEEIFERILETPLALQLEDLRTCLEEMEGGLQTSVKHWRKIEVFRTLLPAQAPDYLKDLFCSNLRALLEILEEQFSKTR
jgi:hypothetical protein